MKTEVQIKVINLIKDLRFNESLSQAAVGDILGISYGLIGNIESLKYDHKYTLKQIQKLCKYFDFPIERVFLSANELQLPQRELIELLITKISEYYE